MRAGPGLPLNSILKWPQFPKDDSINGAEVGRQATIAMTAATAIRLAHRLKLQAWHRRCSPARTRWSCTAAPHRAYGPGQPPANLKFKHRPWADAVSGWWWPVGPLLDCGDGECWPMCLQGRAFQRRVDAATARRWECAAGGVRPWRPPVAGVLGSLLVAAARVDCWQPRSHRAYGGLGAWLPPSRPPFLATGSHLEAQRGP